MKRIAGHRYERTHERCYICDYSTSGPKSEYFSGLEVKEIKRKRWVYVVRGRPICSKCLDIKSDTTKEEILEEWADTLLAQDALKKEETPQETT